MIATAPIAFAFVPQRTGSRSDDRKFINTHLSRLAAERRKRGKPRLKTLSSTSPPRTNFDASPKQQSHSSYSNGLDHVSAKHHTGLSSPPKLRANLNNSEFTAIAPSVYGDYAPQEHQQTPAPVNLPSTSPVLLSPSSIPCSPSISSYDPFQSAVMPINETTRTLLNFSTDMFRPWVDGMERGENKSAAYSNKFFQSTWDSLQDKTIGYATLARLAIVASTLTQDSKVATIATTLKSRAYESLRSQLSNHSTGPNLQILTQMFSLLSMEVAGKNLEAAAVHAKTLQQLVQRGGSDSFAIDDNLIRSILWHECIRCSFSLGRPIFDIEHLVDHSKLRDCLTYTGQELNSMRLMPDARPSGFHGCGLPRNLIALVTEFRFMSDLGYALRRAPSMITGEVMSAYTFRATYISSNLLTLYNDAQDALNDAFPNSEQELYRTGAVCLAARFWYRCATSHELIDVEVGQGFQVFQVYGTQGPILEKLQEAFEFCQQTGTIQAFAPLWLWILYVGTLAERANIDPSRYFQGQMGTFFKQHCTALALSMGCYSWDAVEQVLSSFLYSSEVGPLSRIFFEETARGSPTG